MSRPTRLLHPTATRLALLGYALGVALLAWVLPARPLAGWGAGGGTRLLAFLPGL
jgi:hypothetical protein